mmetsp:Transcript_23676/g.33143  ORF Transcript_23676/g.33143 Transcript_23676/m.33143 type:complete len:620 (-) Transcript_23676:271-2130(-)
MSRTCYQSRFWHQISAVLVSHRKIFAIAAVVLTLSVIAITIALAIGLTKKSEPSCNNCGMYIRVNQVGFRSQDSKTAILMSSIELDLESKIKSEDNTTIRNWSWRVVKSDDMEEQLKKRLFYEDKTDTIWSSNFPYFYLLDFSEVTLHGTFQIELLNPEGKAITISPLIHIATSSELYTPLLTNSLFFFKTQRDGENVDPSILNRQPSHLNDKQAYIYEVPPYTNDEFWTGSSLTKIGGPIDVSGGWFDAGDYLKFVETASYALILMELAARDYTEKLNETLSEELFREIEFGLEWLFKMWNNTSGVLYFQVGIGDGNGNNFIGDHDLWRLPETDDFIDLQDDDSLYYLKFRPIFMSDSPLSPNLGGRLSAAFALCYQLYHVTNSTLANMCLAYAQNVYSHTARRAPSSSLLSVVPFDYYPETQWMDDLQMGSIQLFNSLLLQNANSSGINYYLNETVTWTLNYINQNQLDEKENVNLYDISGISHYEVYKSLYNYDKILYESALASILSDYDSRLQKSLAVSSKDCFGLGLDINNDYDITPKSIGTWMMAVLHRTFQSKYFCRFSTVSEGLDIWKKCMGNILCSWCRRDVHTLLPSPNSKSSRICFERSNIRRNCEIK